VGQAAESSTDGGAEGGEDSRPCVVEPGEEGGFGAATVWGERREGDGERSFGEVGGSGPAIGDGEQNGAFVVLQEGFGRGPMRLADSDADTGGEATEGIGERRGEGGNVVESENPVLAGESQEIADGRGCGRQGRGAGIDEGAEHTGGEALAGEGRALEDEEGERSVGPQGAENPGEAAEPVGAAGEIETGAEDIEGRGRLVRGWDGCGKGGG
jgi:hypothetical protein